MPISKRKRPARPTKKQIKPSPFQRECDRLYNRMQSDPPLASDFILLCEKAGLDDTLGSFPAVLATKLILKVDATISTYQMNYPDHVNYMVTLRYSDKTKKPVHGYGYPSKTVVKSSTQMYRAVILAYIELCKHMGRWL